jgi:hypothetical protein
MHFQNITTMLRRLGRRSDPHPSPTPNTLPVHPPTPPSHSTSSAPANTAEQDTPETLGTFVRLILFRSRFLLGL